MISKEFCHFCGFGLSKRFIEGRERLFCERCQRPIYENPIPATAVVIINEKDEILLVKRNVEPKKGEWCLPGGFLEIGETPEECCLRELKEETGLEGEVNTWAGNELSGSPIYKSVIVMGYTIKNVKGQMRPGDDCDEALYFNPKNLPPIAFKSHRRILNRARESRNNTQQSKILRDFCPMGAYVITSGNHLNIAKRACQAGARILQYRQKNSHRQEILQTAHKIKKITQRNNTLFIINDYLDIALLAKADGVHLGQDDLPIGEARKICPPGFIIGISTHSLQQAIDAENEGADYIGSGPVFPTPTKEDYSAIGINTLKEVINSVSIPVVAIGGINLKNIHKLKNIGVENFAMVRAYQPSPEDIIKAVNG
jgi:thiamine-phosphate diphosphorylase